MTDKKDIWNESEVISGPRGQYTLYTKMSEKIEISNKDIVGVNIQ